MAHLSRPVRRWRLAGGGDPAEGKSVPKAPPKTLWAWSALFLPGLVIGLAAWLVTFLNLLAALLAPTAAEASIRYGLWLVCVSAVIGLLGIAVAASGNSKRAQERQDRAVVPTGYACAWPATWPQDR